MIDLTNITTPFALLDAATQQALQEHGGIIESYRGPVYGWQACGTIRWQGHIVYRVKPQPPNPREWWANVYNTGPGNLHTTRAKADEVGGGRIECIRVREVL